MATDKYLYGHRIHTSDLPTWLRLRCWSDRKQVRLIRIMAEESARLAKRAHAAMEHTEANEAFELYEAQS